MTTANAGPLVAGGSRGGNAMAEVSIKVLRGFMHAGQAVKVGDVLQVNPLLAAELVAMNKAENVAAGVAVTDNNLSTDDAQTVKDEAAATAREGKSNARK